MERADFAPQEETRLIAQAIARLFHLVDKGKSLPSEISSVPGVGSGDAPSALGDFTNKVFSILMHYDDQSCRNVVARLGLSVSGQADAPVPDKLFEDLFARYARPNLGLALEFLIGLETPGASALVAHDPREIGDLALKMSGDGEHISIAPASGGRRSKRKAWSVITDLLQGRFVLLDPQGGRLDASDGVGSLHAPAQAAWRTGVGPAARFTAEETVALLRKHADAICRDGIHVPAVLAMSKDGWLHASRLADVPGDNDADRFADVIKGASRLGAKAICLLDSTGAGPNVHLLLGFASRQHRQVLDLGEENRKTMTSFPIRMPGVDRDWSVGLHEGAAISRARAEAFVAIAGKILA